MATVNPQQPGQFQQPPLQRVQGGTVPGLTAVPMPVPMPPAQQVVPVTPPAAPHPLEQPPPLLELKLYSHSSLIYWWPIWAIGYLMALITYLQGQQHMIGTRPEWFHPSSGPGIVFFLTIFLVILISNVAVRGIASGMVIMGIVLVTVLFAYFGWWDTVLDWFGRLSIHINLGGYVFFSTLMFVVWASTVFIFDRMSYWLIKPGQITEEYVFGAGSKSYDTEGMVLEKHRSDLFRHWILGLGSGDLRIHTMGAQRDTIDVLNVMFLGSKVEIIQRMIAIRPEEFGRATVK